MGGEVRVVTRGAAWLWSNSVPILLSSVPDLAGPLTAEVSPPEDVQEGDYVAVTWDRGRPEDPEPIPSEASFQGGELESMGLADEWLSERAAALDSQNSTSIAEQIAGWGQGLTPSGDDVLIGYLLARRAFDRRSRIDEAGEILQVMDRKCGEPSLSLARWAARGQAFAVVRKARDALLRGAPSNDRAFAALESFGHESGRATLAGMVAGLRAG